MTNRDSANRGELAEVLVNLAFIYRPKDSLADQFLCAAESLLREQGRALAESRKTIDRVVEMAKGYIHGQYKAEARAERLAEYVEHREDCRHYHYIAEKCDCGLDAILSQEPTP